MLSRQVHEARSAMSVFTLSWGRSSRRAVALVTSLSTLLALSVTAIGSTGAERSAAQAAPANQASTSAVALAADPSGLDHAFYRGQDGAVYGRTFRDGAWSAESSIGGRIVGAPSATLAQTTLVVGARGTDGGLWLNLNSNGTWGGWQSVGGVLSAAPAVVGGADGRIDVFVRGTDDSLWTRALPPGGSWSPWSSLGGWLTTGPAGAYVDAVRLDLYAVGGDHAVWHRTWTGSTWSGWQSVGGQTYVAPTVAPSPQGDGAWVFARGTGNGLYRNPNATMGGTAWEGLGGVLIDAPAAAGAAGRVDVVVRGTDNALWSSLFRNGAWSDWGQAWAPAGPPAPASSLLGVDWTRIPTGAPVVALTFDAGANADAVASIRNTLQSRNVPATFFLTGQWVRAFPAQANEIAVAGFLIGNHSDTHPELTTLTDAQVQAEVQNAQRSILLTNGGEVRPLFRFPFGNVDGRVLGLINNLGYVPARWTVDTLGWQGTSGGMTVQRVIDRVMAGLQPGEIVLMHVGSHPTDRSMLDAAALPQIIDAIRARGYGFVTLSALTGQAQTGQ
jgi:peptidoglycan/xylan/chitin deacetylase (PgdA/CDA1 family)